mgnify:FL=1
MSIYRKNQLPQWNVINLIHLDYTFYFGLAHPNDLLPSQPLSDYSPEKSARKRTALQEGLFDPIIVDCNMRIVCGHHRHAVFAHERHPGKIPIICLEGVTIAQVVEYYESICLHEQAVLDEQAEQASFADYADWDNDANIARQLAQ